MNKNIQIDCLPLLSDNYCWICCSEENCVIIDPSESAPVLQYLAQRRLSLKAVLATHHHFDHVGGIPELKEAYPEAEIISSRLDAGKIKSITRIAPDENPFSIGGMVFEAMNLPGHTKGSVAWLLQSEKALFTGDTLFSAGCGRLFEGSPAQMLDSLEKISRLPDDFLVYPAHEYTVKNLRFASIIEPENQMINQRLEEAIRCRKDNIPTLPVLLSLEKKTNPFLRTGEESIMKLISPDPLGTFTELRRRRDIF